MADGDETKELLREIRDLIAENNRQYSAYLAESRELYKRSAEQSAELYKQSAEQSAEQYDAATRRQQRQSMFVSIGAVAIIGVYYLIQYLK